MRIAIRHPWSLAKRYEPLVWDGLHAALRLVGEKHEVVWFLAEDEPDDTYDWILPWGVGSLPFNNTIEKYRARKALLCAGHPDDTANFNKFEVIFVESPKVLEQVRPHCRRAVLAFGTDTDLFKPTKAPKVYPTFYPATFSESWKRQTLFARGSVRGGLACGVVQPDGLVGVRWCEEYGVHTLEGLVPTYIVAQLYNMAHVGIITSWHGSERTVLEMMASNLPLVITRDNELACSLVTDECIQVEPTAEAIREGFHEAYGKTVNTRQHVVDNYSHFKYAERILSVLES